MAKTILVCGFGPGISTSVAERFGKEGFAVGLVARNAEKLDGAAKALAAKGVKAAAFPADLASPDSARGVVEKARASLGPIGVIHWNAYSGAAGDLLVADVAAIRTALDVAVTSLLVTVQAALPDLKKAENAAVLVTNGGFGKLDPQIDALGVQLGAMGLSLGNAAKDKLVGLLAKKLEGDGVFVGQVMVFGTVKGTAFDRGGAPTIEPSAIAERFWDLYRLRSATRVDVRLDALQRAPGRFTFTSCPIASPPTISSTASASSFAPRAGSRKTRRPRSWKRWCRAARANSFA